MKKNAPMRTCPVDHATLKRVVWLCLGLMAAGHAFCFFNLTYGAQSVMLSVGVGNVQQISGGRWLAPIYFALRGVVSAPLTVGLLSALYLTLTCAALVSLLDLKRPALCFALCGTMTLNAAVLSVFAGTLSTADAALLAQLLCAVGALCCTRLRWGTLPGALCLAFALALEASAPSILLGLCALALIRALLRGDSRRTLGRQVCSIALTFALGVALYAAGWALMLRRYGFDADATLRGTSLLAMCKAPFAQLFAPLTQYTHLNIPLRVLLLASGAVALVICARRIGARRTLAVGALCLLMPLAVSLPVFAVKDAGQTSLAYALLDVLPLVLVDAALAGSALADKGKRIALRALACVFGVLFLGELIFANQVYLKKNLEMDATLSVMTRVLARIERVEGFVPGETPVTLVGTLEDSSLSVERPGFEHLSALEAASGNMAIASEEDGIWYTWQVLGYPLSFVDSFTREQLMQREDVQAIPAFPAQDCCQMVDGVLVVKLS